MLSNLVGQIGTIVEGLTLSSREKRELEMKLRESVLSSLDEIVKSQGDVIRAEATGSWLQRSWRPLVMLTFAFIVLTGTFTRLPLLEDSSRFWDLLELGLGGYVIGRSGEKIAGSLFHRLKERR